MFGGGGGDKRKRAGIDANGGRGMDSLGKALLGFKVPQDRHCNSLLKWHMLVGEIEKRSGV